MATPGPPDVGLRVPAERSSFVGRRAELAEVRRLLSGSRLVTLVGPGGVGKTRLAVRAATDLRRSFPDGATFAELASVRDPASVAGQVATALGVRDLSGHWLPSRLIDVLATRQVLIVLDNCEHVRDAAAVLVDTLLTACPRLRVLSTSRLPLDVDGEALLRVPPLPVPEPGTAQGVSSPGGTQDAVRLLTERAAATAPGLCLTAADAPVLADVCRRLDGLPLAIELAAVRLRTLSPEELAQRLDDRFSLLARSGAAVTERHRTLRATMQWSADLLTDAERTLWRRVTVFAADFDVTAAEAVCADELLPRSAVVDVLGRLADASLIERVLVRGRRRFRMLESVRTYGRELLAESGEERALRLRHRDWCARLVVAAAADYVGPDQVRALDGLETVHAELGEALRFSAATSGEEERGLGIAADLWLYWAARGHLGEGRRRVDALLAACPADTPIRARGLLAAGYLALAATDAESAGPLLEQARALAARIGPSLVVAQATQFLGQAALFRADLESADRLFRAAVTAYEATDPRYRAFCWADRGIVALLAGDLDSAREAFDRSLVLGRDGDPWTQSHALWGLGLVRLTAGDHVEATRHEQAALRLMRHVDDASGTALCLHALAWSAAADRGWERAARLAGAADDVWRSIPARLPAPMSGLHEACTAAVGTALGERRSADLQAEGAAMGRTAAVALALDERAPVPTPREGDDGGRLTPRQREVAALVARGLTDREIADRLVISPRTAESHVEQILTRLGFRSRAEIAAWTAERALTGR